jgi:hypothetical protein
MKVSLMPKPALAMVVIAVTEPRPPRGDGTTHPRGSQQSGDRPGRQRCAPNAPRGAIVLRRRWSRGQVEARLANRPPCLDRDGGLRQGENGSPDSYWHGC